MVFRRGARDKFRTRPRDWDREPLFPTDEELLEIGARILNPLEAARLPGDRGFGTTAYFADTLLVALDEASAVADFAGSEELSSRGWQVVADPSYVPVIAQGIEQEALGAVRFRVQPSEDPARVLAPVDAHVVVQLLRARGLQRVGLEHVYVTNVRGHTSGHTEDEDERPSSGRYQSSGGRLPVAYAGRPPARDAEPRTRRPVVGVVDTGCGEHDWLIDGVFRDVGFAATPELPDPEGLDLGGDFVGPLDGVIDPFSGHGTFICGLIRQGCPNADILSWRVVPSTGLVREGDLINALAGIVNLVRSGQTLDVLNLSMGHYHELNAPDLGPAARVKEVSLQDPALLGLLRTLSRLGVAVVCSAGNDGTARPMFPAAYTLLGEDWPVPITAVGSLNPNQRSVSVRSNTGTWVSAYQPGAHVFSTLPGYQGGYEPSNRTRAFGWDRASVDPDDFSRRDAVGGFGLWNGTSFAAPIQAALIASVLEERLAKSTEPEPEEFGALVRGLCSPRP
ncbi:MAG: S8/S53 family peptidase [Nocardioides sp.]